MPEMLLRQIVHVVGGKAGFDRIGDEAGVVDRGDGDAAAGELLQIELHVVADLEGRGVLKHRLEGCEHHIHRQLRQGIAAEIEALGGPVGQRNIAGDARLDGERDADELGAHRVERGRFRVDGDMALIARHRDPALELGHLGDGGIGLVIDRRLEPGLRRLLDGRGCGRVGGARFGQPVATLRHRLVGFRRPAHHGDRQGLDFGRIDADFRRDAPRERGEFHRLEEADKGLRVGRLHGQFLDRMFERHVVAQPHQLARQPGRVGVGDQVLAPLGLLDLVGASQQGFQVAILLMSWAPVLTPMPGTPGILSTESPDSACTSIILAGGTPNFSITSASPILMSFMVS
jgi:hypothetical protein